MHCREIVFEPFDAQLQRASGSEPVLLRCRKELLEPDSGWSVPPSLLFWKRRGNKKLTETCSSLHHHPLFYMHSTNQDHVLVPETRVRPSTSRSYRATMGGGSSPRGCPKLCFCTRIRVSNSPFVSSCPIRTLDTISHFKKQTEKSAVQERIFLSQGSFARSNVAARTGAGLSFFRF